MVVRCSGPGNLRVQGGLWMGHPGRGDRGCGGGVGREREGSEISAAILDYLTRSIRQIAPLSDRQLAEEEWISFKNTVEDLTFTLGSYQTATQDPSNIDLEETEPETD